jgi:hypothetical protein
MWDTLNLEFRAGKSKYDSFDGFEKPEVPIEKRKMTIQ